ncbi:sperm flagellar protein 1 isoform X1 [Salmo salar]|uniref:Sperm flagellar protein 1 isoform X1 n=1 Tax=Salmo salar TaxID=8030 RepID=A0A1S3N258_SALSA|nr:sperm flagellar protein 1 isoform X1 [Salmo salar]XP_029609223.1 sperm flagellar protein 1 isoform X2 [Salmo trutta]|eukprot:XP_014009405.1 PREDICTED: sperm flagellar protein 1 isoform X1 [Salmo salar]
MDKELNEEILQDLFAWIDKIPLSRPKRNITRDFSDGVMAAEVVKYFFPKLVELHNYTPANSIQQKLSNWGALNRKVFSKLNFHIPEETVKRIVDVEYYNNRNQEKPLTEPPPNDAQKKPGLGKKKEERAHVHQHTDKTSTVLGSQVDPTIRLVLEEKEQALLALQETVEILQIKVNRLEHLVQLKDMRLEDLTRHLERYKARANVP